jgi:cyanophycinase
MTGGDQLRLATTIGGSALTRKMQDLNRKGLHIAGTSAGAAFISEHMIAGGKTGNTPRTDMVKLATGLGLTKKLIIDQHFRQRHRIGRLITAITFNPSAIGLGIDEDTAAFIGPDGRFEVVGSGWVTIVDPSTMESTTVNSAKKLQRLSVRDLKIHMLTSGDRYDIRTRIAKLC